jgi:hypothetical protein
MERIAKKAALLALFPLRYYVFVTETPVTRPSSEQLTRRALRHG